jgi:hypothetical protein
MENNKISLLENPKFPGIFVTKKKKSGKSNENDGNDHVKKERTSDSPTSDLGSDQCLSESISTSTAVYNFSSVKEVENGSSSCSYDNHCSCSESTEQGINEAEENEDKDGSKRPRRKKSKEKTEEVFLSFPDSIPFVVCVQIRIQLPMPLDTRPKCAKTGKSRRNAHMARVVSLLMVPRSSDHILSIKLP